MQNIGNTVVAQPLDGVAQHSLDGDDAPLHVGQLLEGPHTQVKVVLHQAATDGAHSQHNADAS